MRSILLHQFLVRLSLIIMINRYKVVQSMENDIYWKITIQLFVFSVSVRPVLSRLVALY